MLVRTQSRAQSPDALGNFLRASASRQSRRMSPKSTAPSWPLHLIWPGLLLPVAVDPSLALA
jgi:hypothetical protein